MERECFFYFSKKLPVLVTVIFIHLRKRNLHLLAQIQLRLRNLDSFILTSELGWWLNDTSFHGIIFKLGQVPWFSWWLSFTSSCVCSWDSKGQQPELMKEAVTGKVTLLLNCSPSLSGVNGIFCRTRTKVPNKQKMLEEDGCSANEFVAAHITEATVIFIFLTECFNKN